MNCSARTELNDKKYSEIYISGCLRQRRNRFAKFIHRVKIIWKI